MIRLRNLSFHYEGADRNSLEDISLTIQKGEFVVLTGESGCGKTTLTRILNGLCPQFYDGRVTGDYLLDGKEALNMSLDELGINIGNVFQDPRSQFFTTNTTDEIVMAMETRNYPLALMQERLDEVSSFLHLERLLDRSVFGLSSGECQKIAIAAATATHPKVLVLDEPSANLDAESTVNLANLLKSLKEAGITIVVSEHRLHYLAKLADRLIVMKNAGIKACYCAKEVLSIPSEQMIDMGLRLFQLPQKMINNPSPSETNFLKVSDISFSRPKRGIIKNASLFSAQGRVIAITGANGTGKSTLCKVISGILRENSGSINLKGKALKVRQRLKQTFFVGQDADYQLYTSNVWDELTLNLKMTPALKSRAEQILQQLNLSEFKMRHPISLSGGQKQRVLLAAALLRNRPILILDEPTSGLDGRHMRITAKILQQISEQHICVLLITHDMEFIQLVADEVLYMKDGCLNSEP